jgi:hypothetical protein
MRKLSPEFFTKFQIAIFLLICHILGQVMPVILFQQCEDSLLSLQQESPDVQASAGIS